MRKRVLNRETTVTSVTLYRDDLDELLKLLNDYHFDIHISDDEFDYDNLADLQHSKGDRVSKLNVRGFHNTTVLDFKVSHNTTLNVLNGDEAFLSVRDFLEKRKRRYLHLISVLVIVLGVATFLVDAALKTRMRWVFIPFIIAGIAFWILMRNKEGAFTRIILTRKHEASSFWKRNKDAIWIVVITAIVTSVMSVLASYFLFRQGIK
jgi:hypothetical protein